ncbi:UNVERIFIED_CONTAM: B-cell CLL/lymphoma 6 member B protein [Trichonephila clavipes]
MLILIKIQVMNCVYYISFEISSKFFFCLSLGAVCRTCHKWFSAKSTLMKHRIWHHKSEFPKFKFNCHLCPYSTNEGTNFKTHFCVHSPDRPFKCEICDNRFRALNSLSNHLLIHKGEKHNYHLHSFII